ncbi:MAG: DNA mismatch repair protein MutS, partial [Bacteroidetes bacterium]|nr:DNA mismatch repair protein MutS [Bacteroidota bacterium]
MYKITFLSMPLTTYQSLVTNYTEQSKKLSRQLKLISFLRLLSFAGIFIFGYYYFSHHTTAFLYIALAFIPVFIFFVRWYDTVKNRSDLTKALWQINTTEIDLINGKPSPYENGKEYINPHHPYSYDLDIFGNGSLYGFLNRTTASFGKEYLAQLLLHPNTKQIKQRQEAIAELTDKISFRQQVQATGLMNKTEEDKLQSLQVWLKEGPIFKNKSLYYLLLVLPIIAVILWLTYFITENEQWQHFGIYSIILNLGVVGLFAKKLSANYKVSTAVNQTLSQFSSQFSAIEKENFQSSLLKELQNSLQTNAVPASTSIARLSGIFNYLDMIANMFASPVLNGLFIFHIHVLFALDKWKEKHADKVMNWLHVIGETEALNSFANFHFNNKDFCFPAISETEDITVTEMGHPLIRKEKRVCNSVSLKGQKFIILTGSNMSGKSTFLRTIGINLVLARAGSSVCASNFTFYPYDVYVSMRISDSLQDSESFFYAELKRLQTIIQHLQAGNKTFVMLDEILRGTNSNDKHSGTIGLIHKLAAVNACGIIATHDLTV